MRPLFVRPNVRAPPFGFRCSHRRIPRDVLCVESFWATIALHNQRLCAFIVLHRHQRTSTDGMIADGLNVTR